MTFTTLISPDALAIRTMCAEDLEAVVALEREVAEAPHWSRAEYLAAVETAPSCRLHRVALVAKVCGECAGFVVVRLVAGEAELESLVVEPRWRGQGIGSALLAAAVGGATAQGASRLDLELRKSNAPAANLYRRAGFRHTGIRPGYYCDPDEDAVLMSFDL